MIGIDGSLYSGSGCGSSVVRQAVAYAGLTCQPVKIWNARARRPRPGLRPQHVRAVEAVRDLVGGTLEGVTVGSCTLASSPGRLIPEGPAEHIGATVARQLLHEIAGGATANRFTADQTLRSRPWHPATARFGYPLSPST